MLLYYIYEYLYRVYRKRYSSKKRKGYNYFIHTYNIIIIYDRFSPCIIHNIVTEYSAL